MTHKPVSSVQAAARLLAAIEGPNPMSCEQAQELLTAYVEAERAGVDVDSVPEYADLIRHLEQCEECLSLYSELSEDLATMMFGEGEPLPIPPPLPVGMATIARQTEHVLLRIFAGLQRRFEAVLQVPLLDPQFASLHGGKRAVLLNEQLPEIAGEPVVSISVGGEAGDRDLLVAVSDDHDVISWDVRVTVGVSRYSATTDEHGIARFVGIALDNISQVVIFISEADRA